MISPSQKLKMMWKEARRRTSHPTRLCTKENSLQVIEADTEGREATPSTPARRRVNAPGDGRGGKGQRRGLRGFSIPYYCAIKSDVLMYFVR